MKLQKSLQIIALALLATAFVGTSFADQYQVKPTTQELKKNCNAKFTTKNCKEHGIKNKVCKKMLKDCKAGKSMR